jgi:hypothetical protein
MKRNREITPTQEKLIAELLVERSVESACRKTNVAVTTYWRWMQDPRFLEQYRKARRGILENTVARIQSITLSALDTLERNLNCENPSVEVRCAAIILEQSIKGVESLDVAARLELLEALVNTREERGEQVR